MKSAANFAAWLNSFILAEQGAPRDIIASMLRRCQGIHQALEYSHDFCGQLSNYLGNQVLFCRFICRLLSRPPAQ